MIDRSTTETPVFCVTHATSLACGRSTLCAAPPFSSEKFHFRSPSRHFSSPLLRFLFLSSSYRISTLSAPQQPCHINRFSAFRLLDRAATRRTQYEICATFFDRASSRHLGPCLKVILYVQHKVCFPTWAWKYCWELVTYLHLRVEWRKMVEKRNSQPKLRGLLHLPCSLTLFIFIHYFGVESVLQY